MSSNQSNPDIDTNIAPLDDEEDNRVMRLGASSFGGDGAMTDFGDEKPKINNSTAIVIGVIILAAVGLYSMRTIAIAMASGNTGDTAVEATVDEFINALIPSEDGDSHNEQVVASIDHNELGGVLLDDRTELQVPWEQVQKNPFVAAFGNAPKVTNPATDTEDPAAILARNQMNRRGDFERGAANLSVLMILGGSKPMANISGSIVNEGDIVVDDRTGEEFTVRKIEHGLVSLIGEDKSLDLKHEIVLHLNTDEL